MMRALTVSELNEYVRKVLATDPLLCDIEVTGEISGWKDHYSGHKYFALKDAQAKVPCVMFRQDALGLDFRPTDGMRVTAYGSASLFPRDGVFQLYVRRLEKDGEGELYLQFERLKRKLMAEGLFDAARKRAIPIFPKIIGVATSETGAVIQDIMRVSRRRNPNIGILLAPCAVQGAGAAEEIVRAIKRLNASKEPDVILVGRGGGSIEDLWAFNEESVARAIAASKIPIISCVGHETDFTIADFVADVRAATPSAAAELAVPMAEEWSNRVRELSERLTGALTVGQNMRRMRLEKLMAHSVFSAPDVHFLMPRRSATDAQVRRLHTAMQGRLTEAKRRLERGDTALRTLNPNRVLERGYAIVERGGKTVSDAAMLSEQDDICIRMRDGNVRARVAEGIHGDGEN